MSEFIMNKFICILKSVLTWYQIVNLVEINVLLADINIKLIYIKSTMNYSTIRSILKKINDTQTLKEYLDKEKLLYEIYQEERKIITNKRNENLKKQIQQSFVEWTYNRKIFFGKIILR